MGHNFEQGDNVLVLHNLQKTFERYGSTDNMSNMSGKIFKLSGVGIRAVYIRHNGYRYAFAMENVQKIHENEVSSNSKSKKIEIFDPINLDLS